MPNQLNELNQIVRISIQYLIKRIREISLNIFTENLHNSKVLAVPNDDDNRHVELLKANNVARIPQNRKLSILFRSLLLTKIIHILLRSYSKVGFCVRALIN